MANRGYNREATSRGTSHEVDKQHWFGSTTYKQCRDDGPATVWALTTGAVPSASRGRTELCELWWADVDAEVEEALPLEQALRSLTHWHNIKRYPDQMGADTKLLEEEHDFFVRELEKMEWIEDGMGEGESVAESGWDGVGNGW